MHLLAHNLDTKGYLSLSKFTDYLRECQPAAYVSYPTALKLANAGKIRATKVGGVWRVSKEEAERWVAEGNWEVKFKTPYINNY